MKAAVISLGSVSSKWEVEALKKYFDEVDDISLKDVEVNVGSEGLAVMHKGEPIGKYDCIYAKGSFRYKSVLRALTAELSKTAYMPIKADAFTTGHDKLLSHLKMQEYKVPMPKTYLFTTPESAKSTLKQITYPIIMKFPEGTQGKGVMFADSFASANSILDALIALKQPFIIQEYIDTGGEDIRAIVVGDKVVAAMKRRAVKGETRANIHAGGKGKAYTPDKKTEKIAISTAKAIGAEICAVDILEGAKGPLVIEINLSPGLQGITSATKIDVADCIAKFLHEKAKERFGEKASSTAADMLQKIEPVHGEGTTKEIMASLDIRGERILLPAFVTQIGSFNDTDDYNIAISEGRLVIERLKFGKEKKKKPGD